MNKLIISGKEYIASSVVSKETSYSNDYIGQLCRSGKLDCQQVAGSWFVSNESLGEYIGDKIVTEDVGDVRGDSVNISDKKIIVDGVEYIPTAEIAEQTGYTQDYIGQLARKGEIPAKRVGRRWYADLEVVRKHKKQKDLALAKVQAEAAIPKKEKNKKIKITRNNSSIPKTKYITEKHKKMVLNKVKRKTNIPKKKPGAVTKKINHSGIVINKKTRHTASTVSMHNVTDRKTCTTRNNRSVNKISKYRVVEKRTGKRSGLLQSIVLFSLFICLFVWLWFGQDFASMYVRSLLIEGKVIKYSI